MTNTFKAGDKVLCIRGNDDGRLVYGREYIVSNVLGSYVDVVGVPGPQGWVQSRFELKYPALKAGDLVRVVQPIAGVSPTVNASIGMTFKVANVRSGSVELVDPATGRTFPGGGWGRDRFEPVQSVAKIDLQSLKPGDKVTLTVTLEVDAEADCDGDVALKSNDLGLAYLYNHRSHTGTVERAPEPLKVGDKVSTKSGQRAVIKALDGDMAWVALDYGNHTVRPVSELTRRAA